MKAVLLYGFVVFMLMVLIRRGMLYASPQITCYSRPIFGRFLEFRFTHWRGRAAWGAWIR